MKTAKDFIAVETAKTTMSYEAAKNILDYQDIHSIVERDVNFFFDNFARDEKSFAQQMSGWKTKGGATRCPRRWLKRRELFLMTAMEILRKQGFSVKMSPTIPDTVYFTWVA